MICETCDNGLGQVSRIEILGPGNVDVIFSVCPECQGPGYTCNRCGGNPARCHCDDDDKDPPRVIRQKLGGP